MSRPQVSVLIDTYNHERFIEQAVRSVLDQDFPTDAMEVIVVDDGSTDRTPEVVRGFEPRVRLIHKPNGGQASAFNAGIPETRGEFVAFLDGDDWWAKTKLRTVLKAFATDPNVAAVGHGFFEVSEDGRRVETFMPAETCRFHLSSTGAARIASLGRVLLGTWITVRRSVLDRIGPIPTRLVYCADNPILTLALALGGAVIINQPLGYYRRHSANLFLTGLDTVKKMRRKCEMLDIELEYLPPKLGQFGVAPEVITTFFEQDRIESDRLRLQLEGGSRWKTFQTEMRDFKASYRRPSPSYFLFKCLVATATLLVPPRQFYRIRDWYGRKNLARFRKWFASEEPTVSPALFQRRPVEDSRSDEAART